MSQKYKYTNLIDLKNDNTKYNLYALIYDATFPSYDDSPTQFVCTMKVMDNFLNRPQFSNNFDDEVVTLVFKSTNRDSLPFAHHIGDIIRIHRGIFSPKNKRNVYINLPDISKVPSAWCIFAGASDPSSKSFAPLQSSHQNYTFEEQDKTIISKIRNWLKIFFKNPESIRYSHEIKLSERFQANYDFDITVKIIGKKQQDKDLFFTVMDDTDICELKAEKYFDYLNKDHIVRIRSVRNGENKNSLSMCSLTNILAYYPCMYIYSEFNDRLSKTNLSKISDNKKYFILTPDNDFNPDDTETNSISTINDKDKHQYNLTILEISPSNTIDFVKVYCKKCAKSNLLSVYKGDECKDGKFYCKACNANKNDCKLIYDVEFIAQESLGSDNLIKLRLNTYDDEGKNFFNNIMPIDVFKTKSKLNAVTEFCENLTTFRNYISIFAIQEGKTKKDAGTNRIIGTYQFTK